MDTFRTLVLERDGAVLYVWLNRPEARNAINELMIEELSYCFSTIAPTSEWRAVVLGGSGGVFCAGADLQYMRSLTRASAQQNQGDALKLASLFALLDACPSPLVARVQKAAIGGAMGLLACCDTVICSTNCRFAFSEARLGLSPATIAPYVVRKLGISHARDLFLSGESFNAEHALRLGLVHAVVAESELDEVLEAKLAELLMAGPLAARATKQLLRQLQVPVSEELATLTANLIAELRVSPEGQEGMAAFFDKRPPSWQAGSG